MPQQSGPIYLCNQALPPSHTPVSLTPRGLSQNFLGTLRDTEPVVMGQGLGINKTETFEDPKDLTLQ